MGKPQFIWLFALLILFACITNQRFWFIAGFLTGFIALMITSIAILPSWPVDILNNMQNYSRNASISPTLIWYLSKIVPQSTVTVVNGIAFVILLSITGLLFHKWLRKEFSALALIAWCGWVTNLFDPSGLTPDKIVLLIPILLWTMHQYPARATKVVWPAALVISNTLFVLEAIKRIPMNALNYGSIVFFTIWLVFVLVETRTTKAFPKPPAPHSDPA